MSDQLAILRQAAAEFGFDVLGVTSAEPLEEALAKLQAWWAAGHGADLGYMGRNPPERADPRTLFKHVRSVISVAVNYFNEAPPFQDEARYGRVAKYAWGLDYHDVLIPRLKELGKTLVERLDGASRFRAASDYSPFLERAAAVRSGTGFFGKNTCLLQPRHGSYFLLGELMLDVPLPGTEPESTDHCGTCLDCLPACPTDALVAAYRLDARRCISYLTIESQGFIPAEFREKLGPWVFGCDACQDVCPFNRFATQTSWPEFAADRGAGPRLDLIETLSIRGDEAFKAKFEGTPLVRSRRRGLLRNAAVVARNIGAVEAVPALEICVREDPEPLIRGHALWALAGLDSERALRLAKAVERDPDDEVRVEALSLL